MASTSRNVKVIYEIERFNANNNFSYRSSLMKNLLISQKLHNVVAGKEKKVE